MKRKCLALALVAAFAAALPTTLHAATPSRALWVPAVAKATGRGGESFVSSVRIVNPNAQAASVKLTYLPQSPLDGSGSANGDNSGQTPVTVIVGANDTVAIEDVAASKFGAVAPFGISAGGIRIESDQPVIVQTRTFVSNASFSPITGAQLAAPGTFGFTIPAQTTDETVAVGDVAYIPYTSAASSASTGFRSNFIMLNTAAATSVVNVKLATGTISSGSREPMAIVGEKQFTLAKLAGAQAGDIAALFGRTDDDTNLTLIVSVLSGGPVAVGLSIIDNRTASLNYAPPAEVSRADNGVFAIALDDGGFGLGGRIDIEKGTPTFLSGTLVLTCPDGDTAFILQAFPAPNGNAVFTKNADGSWGFTGSTSSSSYSGTIISDVDGTIFGTITYSRTTGSCSGVQKTFGFYGAKAGTL